MLGTWAYRGHAESLLESIRSPRRPCQHERSCYFLSVTSSADPGSADGVRFLLGLAPGRDAPEDIGTKGGRTREAILAAGVALACRTGLGGLTFSALAADVGMS